MRPEMILYFPDGGNITAVSFSLNFRIIFFSFCTADFKIDTRVLSGLNFIRLLINIKAITQNEYIFSGVLFPTSLPFLPYHAFLFPFFLSFPSFLIFSAPLLLPTKWPFKSS